MPLAARQRRRYARRGPEPGSEARSARQQDEKVAGAWNDVGRPDVTLPSDQVHAPAPEPALGPARQLDQKVSDPAQAVAQALGQSSPVGA